MDDQRRKEEADIAYELWRRGESKAHPDRIYDLLNQGYSPEEAADVICRARELAREERRIDDDD